MRGWALGIALAFAATATAVAQERAVVQVLGVGGVEPVPELIAGVPRTVFRPERRFGSGTRVDDRHIATAASLVDGLEVIFVRFAGGGELRPAVVVSKGRDLALLRITPEAGDFLATPVNLPVLTPGQNLEAVGYPGDVALPVTALASLRRLDGQGRLELQANLGAASLGGPVLAGANLVGVIIGVEGTIRAAPVSAIRALFAEASVRTPTAMPGPMDWLFDDSVSVGANMLITPPIAALVAHHHWRTIVRALRSANAASPSELPASVQSRVDTARTSLQQALAVGQQDAGIASRYRLEALVGELSRLDAQRGTEGPPITAAVAPVPVAPAPTYGPGNTFGPGAAYQQPVVDDRPKRLVLQFGPIFGGEGVFVGVRGAGLYDVMHTRRFQLFAGVSAEGGQWFSACDCEDDFGFFETSGFYAFGLDLGARLRAGRFYFEVAYALGYFNAYDQGFADVRNVRLTLGFQWRVFGFSVLYRFRFLGQLDNSRTFEDLTQHTFGPNFTLNF
ncbi:MAG: serine protease [Myxococcota bacterium]